MVPSAVDHVVDPGGHRSPLWRRPVEEHGARVVQFLLLRDERRCEHLGGGGSALRGGPGSFAVSVDWATTRSGERRGPALVADRRDRALDERDEPDRSDVDFMAGREREQSSCVSTPARRSSVRVCDRTSP